jgi:hypothetical protein
LAGAAAALQVDLARVSKILSRLHYDEGYCDCSRLRLATSQHPEQRMEQLKLAKLQRLLIVGSSTWMENIFQRF